MKTWKPALLGVLTVFAAGIAPAGPVTAERTATLDDGVKPAWTAYLENSEKAALLDQAMLDAELEIHSMDAPLKAPNGGDFRIKNDPDDAWFASEEASALADSVLSFQTPSGGWSKHMGYTHATRQPGMLFSSQYEPGHSRHYLATFDNGATTTEIYFLACLWRATGREDCKEAVSRGLDFILASQYPNGGWPQGWPLEGKYHDDITLNDDALTNTLEVLNDIASGAEQYACLGDTQKEKAKAALGRALDFVVRAQVRQGETLTGWCAQYDALTLEPASARLKEPPALASIETSNLVKFLITLDEPSPAMIDAVNAAFAWLEAVQVSGITKTKIDGKTTYVANPASDKAYWARFYDPATNKPLFPGSEDGIIYNSYAEMAENNHSTGYDFYSTRPKGTINSQQKKWRKKLAKMTPAPGE